MTYLHAFCSCAVYGFGTEPLYGPAAGDGNTRVEYAGMIDLLNKLTVNADFSLDASVAISKLKFTQHERVEKSKRSSTAIRRSRTASTWLAQMVTSSA